MVANKIIEHILGFELCEKLAPIYGKRIWLAPSLPYFTEYKLQKAHDIAVARGKVSYGYLLGVMKRLV